MTRKRLRRSEARIEPANFAPAWDSMLQKAMETGPFRQRFAGNSLRMTTAPMKDVEIPFDSAY